MNMKKYLFLPFLLFSLNVSPQIVIDNNHTYDVPSFLVDNVPSLICVVSVSIRPGATVCNTASVPLSSRTRIY